MASRLPVYEDDSTAKNPKRPHEQDDAGPVAPSTSRTQFPLQDLNPNASSSSRTIGKHMQAKAVKLQDVPRPVLAPISNVASITANPKFARINDSAKIAIQQHRQPIHVSVPASSRQAELEDDKQAREGVAADYVAAKDPDAYIQQYLPDIMNHLFHRDRAVRPRHDYMSRQADISHSMRSILVDWLVEVSTEYALTSETLFISISYIDRFLSCMAVQRGKLQLVGVTCMLLAAKYEEISPPSIQEFVYVTDNSYSHEQVIKMEQIVLKVLHFDLGNCTTLTFLGRFLAVYESHAMSSHLAMYLSELALLDGDRFLKYRSSVIAASAVCLARYCCQLPFWSHPFHAITRLTPESLQDCVKDLHYALLAALQGNLKAVREKYSSSKYGRVARREFPRTVPVLVSAP